MRLFLLNEFATAKNVFESELRNHSYQILKHVIKIFLFPESNSVNHWKQEIWGMTVPFVGVKLKGKNKSPKKSIWKKILSYERMEDSQMKSIFIDILTDEKYQSLYSRFRNHQTDFIYRNSNSVYGFYEKFCSELSHGDLDRITLYELLDDVMK